MHGIGNNFYILHFFIEKIKSYYCGVSLFLSSCADINKIPKKSQSLHWLLHPPRSIGGGTPFFSWITGVQKKKPQNKTQNSFLISCSIKVSMGVFLTHFSRMSRECCLFACVLILDPDWYSTFETYIRLFKKKNWYTGWYIFLSDTQNNFLIFVKCYIRVIDPYCLILIGSVGYFSKHLMCKLFEKWSQCRIAWTLHSFKLWLQKYLSMSSDLTSVNSSCWVYCPSVSFWKK